MFPMYIYSNAYSKDSLPYLIRLRQCIIEYGHQGNACRRPLYNALKYATAFPVIYLSAAQHIVEQELVKEKGHKATETSWHGEYSLFRLWSVTSRLQYNLSWRLQATGGYCQFSVFVLVGCDKRLGLEFAQITRRRLSEATTTAPRSHSSPYPRRRSGRHVPVIIRHAPPCG